VTVASKDAVSVERGWQRVWSALVARDIHAHQGCSPKKEVGGRLKQDLDKDLQLHRILILLD